jgi:hypoxanthine-DNA glycosylase
MTPQLPATLTKRCFPPVVNSATRVLVLGSLPGEKSLALAQYYAHPQNKFWLLVGEIIGRCLVDMAYQARLDLLLEHRIGLWDVVSEAQRTGSLDSRIRNHASNDLLALVETLPNLVAIAFNGGAAEKIGMSTLGKTVGRYHYIRLPSSSPAYAAVSYQQKLVGWRQLSEYLAD